MSRFIVQAVYNGTQQKFCPSGRSIESVLSKLQKDRIARNATVFLFFSRKTGKLIDTRFN